MGLLEEAREKLITLIGEKGIDISLPVEAVPLDPIDAIGDAEGDFVLKKGKERVIEARLSGSRGQAFTDRPSSWSGSVDEALDLDLSEPSRRALFVAAMNALLRSVDAAGGTVHCRDEDPVRCGPEIARAAEERFGKRKIGLVGLQPAILGSLVERFGGAAVRVIDLNPENVGEVKSGIEVWDGETDLPRLVRWCDAGLATGSSIVNGTIDEIGESFRAAGKPVVFFGNTIAGAAALLGLERLCPFGR